MKQTLSTRLLVGLASAMLLIGCNQTSAPSSVDKPTETGEPSETTVAEPASSEPASSELVPSASVTSEPASSEPASSEPASSKSGSTVGTAVPPNEKFDEKPLNERRLNEEPANAAATEAPSETTLSAAQDELAERLGMAGIENPQEAKDFLAAMSAAATKEDRDAIANLIHYPFTIYDTGEAQKEYGSPAEFLTDFEQIVTDSVLSAMQNASYDDLFVNYQGAMIGNGAVWFMKYDEGVRVKAINSF